MKRRPPFFSIGNARRFEESPEGEPTFQNNTCLEKKISATNVETLYHQDVTIVDLVESKDGTFSFVPRDGDISPPIPPSCQIPYIYNWALGHLDSFATLLRRCDVKLRGHHYSHGQCDKADLTRLEDDTVSGVLYSLLPVSRLFAWHPLLQARNNGHITWAGIRALLAIARMNVPFLTRDGILKHVLANQITFTQFIAFSELLQQHLQSAACLNNDSLMTTNESITENLTSSEDMTVELIEENRNAAMSSGFTVPKPPETVPPKEEEPQGGDEAGISRADSHFSKNLSKNTMAIWFRRTQERLRQSQMLQTLRKQASLADAAYNKRLMTNALKMLQEYTYLQKKIREQEPPLPAEEIEIKPCEEVMEEVSAPESEPEQMEVTAADSPQTSTDDVDREKYNRLYARAILMDSILDRNRKQVTFLQKGALFQMKAERLKGKENIFSVPNEYVHTKLKPQTEQAYVDYRKEVARKD